MATISRRPAKPPLSSDLENTAHNGHHISSLQAKDNSNRGGGHGTAKRRVVTSFFSGALCMGAILFALRDYVAMLCPPPTATTTQTAVVTEVQSTTTSTTTNSANEKDWKWFEGDVNQFYNELEKDHKRDPTKIANYAVHRWMGTDRSTTHHYELLQASILRYYTGNSPNDALRVLDAGCGLGSAMKWLEERQPTWDIVGHTLSEEQVKFIHDKLPAHKFKVVLKSFDDLDTSQEFDVIYSIEAMIHSMDIQTTLKAWSQHLNRQHGSLVVIDDFLMPGADKSSEEMQLFQRGWMANSFYTVVELNTMARKYGMELVESRDLLAEYRVVELNYKNKVPSLAVEQKKSHQGWIGSKLRHKLTVEGKIGYNLLVFRRMGAKKQRRQQELPQPKISLSKNLPILSTGNDDECASVPRVGDNQEKVVSNITPKKECLSSWYCCDQHKQYLNTLKTKRTNKHGFLMMDESLFGNYMEAFARHLNEFYETIPLDYTSGRFLDIGATGSTASGMQQVTSKFAHFVGPLQYWMLDSDQGAKSLPRTIYCDICDCPQGDSCGFDVTFSHTVLEHAARPEKAFDTVARLTKKGGLTLHLVPWSYQYHATPDDYYRFSHAALKVLMEDRGFEPLEIGYDLCSKPQAVMKRVDEHYDFIWLTYVIAKKL
ncbi:O-methyltransferase [Seminavis robusta]|uniref:O-methyltransferase n=1 Tax=Seminavis robusta TaxID=568900 RepID=A0A9N8DQ83_9STRA|nr:O-methyltransferase [Seminavis robusta]|eukprot:Sro262_g101930.1 O-methyltransferase (657) ;mRNA; f:8398-10462